MTGTTRWVIPSQDHPTRPTAECVASIRAHHPDDFVAVVDTGSDDLGYLDGIDADETLTIPGGYHVGAYAAAWDRWGGSTDRWCWIHDTITVRSSLADRWGACTNVAWFGPIWGDLHEIGARMLADMGVAEVPFFGVLGGMLFVDGATAERIAGAGWLGQLPTSKREASATERTLGVVLAHLGIDPEADSLHGQHTHPGSPQDGQFVVKRFLNRS